MSVNVDLARAENLKFSNEKLKSHIDVTYMWQPIVNRNYELFGSEIFTKSHHAVKGLALNDVAVDVSKSQLQIINSDLLTKIQLMALLSNGRKPARSRRIINIQQASLLDRGLVDELIQASNTLKDYNQQLVIVINSRLQYQDSHIKQKNIARHLYMLKDHDIEVALDNYEKGTSHQEPMIGMNLCDYIKVDLQKSKIISRAGHTTSSLNEVYDDMSAIIYARGVSFIAGNIDARKQYDIARSMPFSLFQGSYFSSPEEI